MITHSLYKEEREEEKKEKEKKNASLFFSLQLVFLSVNIGKIRFCHLYVYLYNHKGREIRFTFDFFSYVDMQGCIYVCVQTTILTIHRLFCLALSLSLSLSVFRSLYIFFFCWKREKEKERASRMTTNDVRRRPSSWSFAFCPPRRRRRKERNCYRCCHYDVQKILFYFIIPLSWVLLVFTSGNAVESAMAAAAADLIECRWRWSWFNGMKS